MSLLLIDIEGEFRESYRRTEDGLSATDAYAEKLEQCVDALKKGQFDDEVLRQS